MTILLLPLWIPLRGAGRLVRAWHRWVTRSDTTGPWHAPIEGWKWTHNEIVARRRVWTRRALLTSLVVGLLLWLTHPWLLLLPTVLLATAAVLAGWRDPRHDHTVRPVRATDKPRRAGGSLTAALADTGITAQLAGTPTNTGWVFTTRTRDRVTDDTLRAVERATELPTGSARLIPNRSNAGAPTLRVDLHNPLDGTVTPPEHATGSLSIHEPLPVGRGIDHTLELPLLRLHALCVGATGSGKSSALWVLIDVLTACRDTVVWGIDLSDGPMMDGWGDAIQRRAKTPQAAADLLDTAEALIHERGQALSTAAAADTSDTDTENHQPTPAAPQLVLVVDELALLTSDKTLQPRLERIIRTGRKTAVTLILAGQKATKADFGSTVVKSQVGCHIVMACTAQDVATVWGGDRGPGWTPHLLTPGLDSGTCYISSPAHRDPQPYRFHRLEQPQVKTRRRQRLTDGLPTLPGPAPPELHPLVAQVAMVFTPGEAELPTRVILQRLDQDLRPADLGAAFRPHGIPIGRYVTDNTGRKTRGYYRADLETAIHTAQQHNTHPNSTVPTSTSSNGQNSHNTVNTHQKPQGVPRS